jgi:hypothetical protein
VKNYAGFNLLAWLGSCAVVVALAGCGDRETVQSTPAPAPAQTPMTPAEMYAKEKLQEYRAAKNDDEAWEVFAAACTANTLTDTEARASVAPMISDGWESWPLPGKTQPPASVAARQRQDPIFNRFALVYAAGFPDAWGGKSMRMSLIRYMLVRDRVRAGLGKLEPHERQMVKDEMVEACQQGIYRQTVDFCTEVNNWDGWEPAERQEFARMFLVSTNFTGFDKKLLGRDDDGLEEMMRDEVLKRWSADRTILVHTIPRLNSRNDTNLLPILLSMKQDIEQNGGACGQVPCAGLLPFLSREIWRAQMTIADRATLIDVLENEVEGSRAYGYGRGDEMRLVVCERLLAAGVPPKKVRKSFLTYVAKLNPSNPPNAAWSRPVRSLAILKRRLIDLGVLGDNDLPGVQAPRALPRIEE